MTDPEHLSHTTYTFSPLLMIQSRVKVSRCCLQDYLLGISHRGKSSMSFNRCTSYNYFHGDITRQLHTLPTLFSMPCCMSYCIYAHAVPYLICQSFCLLFPFCINFFTSTLIYAFQTQVHPSPSRKKKE